MEKPQKSAEEWKKDWKIRSFVRHHGRVTPAQAEAFEKHWTRYGVDYVTLPFEAADVKHHTGHDFSHVVFEIGFGNGESFIDMATASPDTLFLGAEVHKPGVGRAMNLAAERDLDNVKVWMHDAVEILENSIKDASIDRVQIYFPDPWHKKRHFKRRLVQTEFCLLLAKKLKPNGLLHIATDWQPYAEHCLEILNSMPEFENISPTQTVVDKPDYRPETKFERRGLTLGHEVSDLIYRKKSND